jgi:hypothetical protein
LEQRYIKKNRIVLGDDAYGQKTRAESGLRRSQLESAGMGGLRGSDPVYKLAMSGGVMHSDSGIRQRERDGLVSDARGRPEGERADAEEEGLFGATKSALADMARLPEGARPVAALRLNRGKLIGAALDGRFEMVLHSALERTVGLREPKNERQRKLFESGYKDVNISGYHKDAVYTNSGEPDSPVAVAVRDVLRSARSVTEELRSLLDSRGNESLRKLYPFLDTDGDKQQLASLRARAEAANASGDSELGDVLERAVFKYEAIIERKSAERTRFSRNLAIMAENVERALLEYGGDEFDVNTPPEEGTAAATDGQPTDDGVQPTDDDGQMTEVAADLTGAPDG